MGKLKKLFVLGAVGAGVTAIAKKLQAGGGSPAEVWQSAPERESAPRPTEAVPPTPAPPTPAPVEETPDELLVDNAPAPEVPDTAPDTAPDPLTDPLPDEEQRPPSVS